MAYPNIHHWLNDSRVVVPYKIQKALDKGNMDGVKRLAKFVCCESVWPDQIYSACEEQRVRFYQNYKK